MGLQWEQIDGGNNRWDHNVDQWPGHEKEGYTYPEPEDEDGDSGANGLRIQTLSLLSASMLSLLGALTL